MASAYALGKLLKPGFLRAFLQDALALAPPSFFLAIQDISGAVLATHGPLPDDLAPSSPGVNDFPLNLNNTTLGRLLAGGDPALAPALGCALAHSLAEAMAREATRRALGEETLELYRESALTNRAVLNLNLSMRLPEVAASLLAECQEGFAPAECGMVFLMNPDTDRYELFDSYGTLPRARLARLPQSGLFTDVLARGKGEIVNELAADPRWAGEVPELTSILLLPLESSGHALGALALGETRGARPFQSVHLKRVRTLTSVAGIAMSNSILFGRVQEVLTALMQTMATAIDSRDHCTAGHSHRVARYAQGLMHFAIQELEPNASFSESNLQEIYYAGLLHDVGKIGVREEVLTKATRLPASHLELIGLRLALWGQIENREWEGLYASLERVNRAYDLAEADVELINACARLRIRVAGRSLALVEPEEQRKLLTPRGNLTAEEWEEIKRHPVESHRILKNIPFTGFFPNLLTMILQHHERLDGSGYPHGIKGETILPQSRILAIVDVFDSLRRDRHYKKALPQELALKILQEEALLGKLDQDLVAAFVRNIAAIEKTVDLDTGLPACEFVQ
ncbi:MAG: HD domain-containing phosphohydrolase [Thermodesulfobacteriota bacterium]